MIFQILSLLIGVLFAVSIIIVRIKASNKPTNSKKILLPPLFMSTGFLMFLSPQTRVPMIELVEAFLVGALFSILLIKTSKFHKVNGEIFLKRSKAFIFILIGLLAVRTIMKIFLEQEINLGQTGGLFFTLAFGMILPWRIAMYIMYKRLLKTNEEPITT
jgi:membrane protein CcdC involved in cytochrome C biogenesis